MSKTTFLKLTNTIIIIAILGLITFELHFLSRAQSRETSVEETSEEAAVIPVETLRCPPRLKAFVEERRVPFGEFMNTHFRSAKPTSELIPKVIELFRQYRVDVRTKMEEFSPIGGSRSDIAIAERSACEKAMKDEFTFMKELMRQHIVENAYAKKSTRLLDKYKEINLKLERLNMTIAQMYGYFGALSQKLPCYATQCVGQ